VTEEEFRRKLYVLGLDYQAAIKAMNDAPDQYLKERYRRQGYTVMAEISALEREYRSRCINPFIVGDSKIITRNDPVIEPRSTKSQQELQWWEAQYASKLADLGGNRQGRAIPTPEELRYFEDKIESMGGDVVKAEPPDPWIEYHDKLVKEWFDGEKALIDDLYPDPPKRVANPHLHRDVFIGTTGIVVACFVISKFLLYLFT
jgi:hypothetical protein